MTIGDTATTPEVLETFFWSVWRRGSVARGSLWEELEEPLDEVEEPDLDELDEPDVDEVDEPDLDELDEPDVDEVEEPDLDEVELDEDGWACDPSLTAMSNDPFTPG